MLMVLRSTRTAFWGMLPQDSRKLAISRKTTLISCSGSAAGLRGACIDRPSRYCQSQRTIVYVHTSFGAVPGFDTFPYWPNLFLEDALRRCKQEPLA